jgi:hypothetical protein
LHPFTGNDSARIIQSPLPILKAAKYTCPVYPANGLGTWFLVRATAGRPHNFVAHPCFQQTFLDKKNRFG